MITKEKLFNQIKHFADQIDIEDFIERLPSIEEVEKRLSESDENKTLLQRELDNEIDQW